MLFRDKYVGCVRVDLFFTLSAIKLNISVPFFTSHRKFCQLAGFFLSIVTLIMLPFPRFCQVIPFKLFEHQIPDAPFRNI